MSYVLKEARVSKQDIIVDFEVVIHYCPIYERETVRKRKTKIILEDTRDNSAKERNKEAFIVKGLWKNWRRFIGVERGLSIYKTDFPMYERILFHFEG